jgi:hypothetical protein
MKIQTFRDMRGLIYGSDPKRIGCDIAGVLKIGSTEIRISPGTDSIMPMLFNGCNGNYDAIFTTASGVVYTLERVAVRNGWIQPPAPMVLEIMDLKCRMDEKDRELEQMRAKIVELENIFDTNSLNFLIK